MADDKTLGDIEVRIEGEARPKAILDVQEVIERLTNKLSAAVVYTAEAIDKIIDEIMTKGGILGGAPAKKEVYLGLLKDIERRLNMITLQIFNEVNKAIASIGMPEFEKVWSESLKSVIKPGKAVDIDTFIEAIERLLVEELGGVSSESQEAAARINQLVESLKNLSKVTREAEKTTAHLRRTTRLLSGMLSEPVSKEVIGKLISSASPADLFSTLASFYHSLTSPYAAYTFLGRGGELISKIFGKTYPLMIAAIGMFFYTIIERIFSGLYAAQTEVIKGNIWAEKRFKQVEVYRFIPLIGSLLQTIQAKRFETQVVAAEYGKSIAEIAAGLFPLLIFSSNANVYRELFKTTGNVYKKLTSGIRAYGVTPEEALTRIANIIKQGSILPVSGMREALALTLMGISPESIGGWIGQIATLAPIQGARSSAQLLQLLFTVAKTAGYGEVGRIEQAINSMTNAIVSAIQEYPLSESTAISFMREAISGIAAIRQSWGVSLETAGRIVSEFAHKTLPTETPLQSAFWTLNILRAIQSGEISAEDINRLLGINLFKTLTPIDAALLTPFISRNIGMILGPSRLPGFLATSLKPFFESIGQTSIGFNLLGQLLGWELTSIKAALQPIAPPYITTAPIYTQISKPLEEIGKDFAGTNINLFTELLRSQAKRSEELSQELREMLPILRETLDKAAKLLSKELSKF